MDALLYYSTCLLNIYINMVEKINMERGGDVLTQEIHTNEAGLDATAKVQNTKICHPILLLIGLEIS